MYLSVRLFVCLSVCPSVPSGRARRCGGFAAVGPVGRRYRSIAARPAVSSSGAARRNADSAELSVNLVNIFNGIMRRNRYGACLATVWMYTVTFGSIGCTQVARVEIASKRAGVQSSATNDRTSWRQSKRTKNTAECNLSRHTRRWRNQTEIRRQKRTTPYNRQPHAVHKLLPQYSSYSVLQLQSYSAEKILHRDLNCFMHYVLRVYQMCGRSVPIQTNLVINSTDLAGKVL